MSILDKDMKVSGFVQMPKESTKKGQSEKFIKVRSSAQSRAHSRLNLYTYAGEKKNVSIPRRKRKRKAVNLPSISTFRPTVSLHRFPALAILRNRLSASTVFR